MPYDSQVRDNQPSEIASIAFRVFYHIKFVYRKFTGSQLHVAIRKNDTSTFSCAMHLIR